VSGWWSTTETDISGLNSFASPMVICSCFQELFIGLISSNKKIQTQKRPYHAYAPSIFSLNVLVVFVCLFDFCLKKEERKKKKFPTPFKGYNLSASCKSTQHTRSISEKRVHFSLYRSLFPQTIQGAGTAHQFKSLLEQQENLLLQCQLCVLALIFLSVPPPVTAVVHEGSGCRLQLNAQVSYICVCVKWHSKLVHGLWCTQNVLCFKDY